MLYYTDKEVGKTPVFAKNLAPKFECACVACVRAGSLLCVLGLVVLDRGPVFCCFWVVWILAARVLSRRLPEHVYTHIR